MVLGFLGLCLCEWDQMVVAADRAPSLCRGVELEREAWNCGAVGRARRVCFPAVMWGGGEGGCRFTQWAGPGLRLALHQFPESVSGAGGSGLQRNRKKSLPSPFRRT